MSENECELLRNYYRSAFFSPFSVAPLRNKHYGTHVVDARGTEVAEFWSTQGEPSTREKAAFGEPWTPELWADYRSDEHWECQLDLDAAEAMVRLLNGDTERKSQTNREGIGSELSPASGKTDDPSSKT